MAATRRISTDLSLAFRSTVPFAALALSAIIAASASTAQAQEQEKATVLDEIVVTARKREEDPQKLPQSLSVLKGDRLAIQPSASNADMARSVPNFTFVDAGGLYANAANIRGVGSFSPLSSDDTSVVYYVDEAPQSVYSIAPSLMDTERVEVMRGPQGTLFGRNTQGGAVNIVSKRPTFDREFSLTGEVGTNGYALGRLVANGTLVPDTLAGRLAIQWNKYNGEIPNIAAGGKDGGLDIGAARGSFLFTPTDQTEALLVFNYGKELTHSPRFLLRDTPGFPVSATDPRTRADGRTGSVNLRVNHEFETLVLSTQTSYQDSRSTNDLDPTDALVFDRMFGGRPPGASYAIPGADFSQLSLGEKAFQQEIRLSSLPDDPISWTAGINYFHSDSTAGRNSRALTPAFIGLNGIQDNKSSLDSYAVFGEVTLPVTEQLKATFGLRGTHEEKDARFRFSGNGLPGVAPAFSQDGALSDNFLTGRAALSYEWTPEFMTYASISRGYVTAGFPAYSINSAFALPDQAFPASKSWTYEAGFKAVVLDDRLTLNGSAFLNDVTNGHLIIFDPSRRIFTTAALDYQTYGAELELAASVSSDFDVLGGVGYTHAELQDVPSGSFTGAKSGNEVPNVPTVTANIGIEYRWSGESFGIGGEFTGRVGYQYVASRAADVRNTFSLKPYGLVNSRLSWTKNDVEVYAFANNIFDERYEAWGQAFGPLPTVRVGQGRVLGLGTSFQF